MWLLWLKQGRKKKNKNLTALRREKAHGKAFSLFFAQGNECFNQR